MLYYDGCNMSGEWGLLGTQCTLGYLISTIIYPRSGNLVALAKDTESSASALPTVGLVLLTLVHALFLTAHDHRLQFPLYNKNQPLQPVQKRSSRYLNMNAPQAVAVAAVVADSEDDSEDDEAIQRERAAELQENLQLLNQESAQGANGNGAAATGLGGGSVMEPVLGSMQSRFCRSAEGAMPQWRVWGSEAHWYR